MIATAEQLNAAWKAIEVGDGMDAIRRHWDQIAKTRRELDECALALARRIEQLRAEVAEAERREAEAEADTDENEDEEIAP